MSEISKQALKVDNSTSFPNNTTGYISPTILRAFNVNMIDSLVDEIGYTADSASWNVSIGALQSFTASQQPSFTSLNAFTASQLSINSGINLFTQSAGGRLTNLEQYTASFTTSVGIFDESVFVQNVNQIAFSGNGISASYVSGKAVVGVNFTPLNNFTASTSTQLTSLQNNFNSFTQSTDSSIALIEQVTASYATTGSNIFTQNQFFEKNISVTQSVYVGGNIFVQGGIEATYIKTIYETSSVIYSSGSNQLGDALSDNQILSGSTFVEGQLYVNKLNVTDQFAAINTFTASTDQKLTSLISKTGSYATTGSNTFVDTQTINTTSGQAILASGSITLSPGSFISASVIRPTSAIEMQPQTYFRFITGSSYFNMELNPGTGDWAWSRSGTSNTKVLELAGEPSNTSSFANNSVRFLDTIPNVIFDTPVRIFKGIANSVQVTGSLELSDRLLVTNGGAQITGGINLSGTQTIREVGLGNRQNALNYNGISVNTTDSPTAGAECLLYASTASSATTILGIYDNPNFNIDVENRVLVNSAGIVFSDWDNGSAFDYIPYMTIAANNGDNPTPVFTRGLNVSSSLTITGSVYSNVISQSIVSSTASIDLSKANFYRVVLPTSTTTRLNITNPGAGQTAMIQITSNTNASASFSSNVKQPSGFAYVPTPGDNKTDVLTLACFDGTNVLVTNVTNLI
jgi:hypothetical protein